MRVRHKPYARPELEAWDNFINEPQELCGKWKSAFKNSTLPLRVEMGCGKGGFIAGAALRDRNINHLGIDIKNEMLVVAKRTIEKTFTEQQLDLDNILLTNQNIEMLACILAPQDAAERIYINFCNPWYKTGDAKHRLTHPRQLVLYRNFLQKDGEIYFKTDDGPLFEDSLRYFEFCGFDVPWLTRDLHSNEPEWNIRTEHETMFSSEGIPIKACIARMQFANLDIAAISKLRDM